MPKSKLKNHKTKMPTKKVKKIAKRKSTKSDLKKNLKIELEMSILLKDEEKDYWLNQIETLPTEIIEGVYEAVKEKNVLVGKYLNAAFESDPDQKYVAELKQKIKNIKNETLKIEEEKESPDAEQFLEDEMNKL